MKKHFVALAATSLLGVLPLCAQAFTFDDFEDDQGPVSSTGLLDTDEWTVVSNSDVAGLQRQIGVQRQGGLGTLDVSVEGSADGPGLGTFNFEAGTKSAVGVGFAKWCLNDDCNSSTDLGTWSGLKLQISVVSNDLGNESGIATLTFEITDSDGNSHSETVNLDVQVDYGIDPAEVISIPLNAFVTAGVDLSKFQSAKMTIDSCTLDGGVCKGGPGALDVSIDVIESVPEPGSLALLGLGLLGAGAMRRRKVA